ncbi:MAG: methyltransferase, partial [Desulfovibrionaceae bacterium]
RSGPLNPVAEGLFGGAFLPALAAEALSGEARRTADRLLETPGFDAVDDVLDLGGGHALYALALAARLPGLRAEVLDLPSARPLAEGHIRRFGGGDGRVRFRAGDIFHADLGRGRQAVLLFYSPGGKRPDLLERIHACLAPGGFFVSKHAFYAADEGRKDPLLDLEWRLSAFPGTAKGPRVYEFQGDLDRDAYRAELAARFDIVAEHEAPAFAAPDLGKFGDRLDSRLIIARKR